jgi:molybdenum cofactor cytidylyltransferase
MTVSMDRTAVILLASGRSKRFGWRCKLLQDLGGRELMEHAASAVTALDALARIAVCPTEHPRIAEHLQDRFVIAVNKHPKRGMGHSIAVGMSVAMQFKPDAIAVCMADMPFIEPDTIRAVVAALGGPDGVNIAHSGGASGGARPPTAFDASCFPDLLALDGDDGAKRVISSPRFKAVGVNAPAPLLGDVDTREELAFARQLMAIRDKHGAAAGR